MAEHSKNYEKVKNFYSRYWTILRVANSVKKDWITEEEFEEITGISYSEYTTGGN